MLYIYEVSWFSDVDNKMIEENGIIDGEDYGEALNKVVDFYGARAIERFNFFQEAPTGPIALPSRKVRDDIVKNFIY